MSFDNGMPEAERLKWFYALKPGDKVVYEYGRGVASIQEVKKRTPTGKIRLDNGDLFDESCYFYRSSEAAWGSSYRIKPLTERFLRERERSNLAEHMGQKIKWGELPLETLREVQAILNRPAELREFEFETDGFMGEGQVAEYRETRSTRKRVFVHKILSVESGEHPGSFYVKVLGEEVR